MTKRPLVGPATVYVAAELRAQRARLQMTFDELSAASGLSKGAVVGALKGRQAITLEGHWALCNALRIDPGRLLDEAAEAAAAGPEAPTSLIEAKRQRLDAAARPATWAADDRPLRDPDDDWEPR